MPAQALDTEQLVCGVAQTLRETPSPLGVTESTPIWHYDHRHTVPDTVIAMPQQTVAVPHQHLQKGLSAVGQLWLSQIGCHVVCTVDAPPCWKHPS